VLSALFPRFTNRGLIEAPPPHRRNTARSCFPRFTNRGHIEATMHYPKPSGPASFRDLRIAASLKPAIGVGLHQRPGHFPRFTNRGLIEAVQWMWRRSALVSFPRFTNRGLIEASTSLLASNSNRKLSAIYESRPH